MDGPLVLLGPVAWSPDAVPLPGRIGALFAWLALREGRWASRSEVAEAVWPGRPEAAARHLLRQSLVGLRRAAAEAERDGLLETDGDRMRVAARIPTDWTLVRRALGESPGPDRVRRLREALDRYWGEPLAGIGDGWSEAARASALATERRIALELGGRITATLPSEALTLADRCLERDPYDDEARELRWSALETLGDRRAADRERDEYAHLLREEFGLGPSLPETSIPRAARSPFDEIFSVTSRKADRVRLLLAAVPYFRDGGRAEEGLERLRALGPGGARPGERRLAEAELELARGNASAAEKILRDLSDVPGRLTIRARLALARALMAGWHLRDARREVLAALRSAVVTEDRLECLRVAAALHERRRDHRRTRRAAERMRALAIATEDDAARSFAAELLAYSAWFGGDPTVAKEAAAEARAIAESGRAGPRGAYARVRIARLAEEWDGVEEAEAGYATGLTELRKGQERAWLGAALVMAGDFETARGRPDVALPLLQESVEIRRSLGDRVGLSTALRGLGLAHEARGEFEAARAALRAAAALVRTGESMGPLASVLIPLARLDVERRPERAERLAHAALAYLRALPSAEREAMVVKGARLIPEAETILAKSRSKTLTAS